jgi:hypothetical protein
LYSWRRTCGSSRACTVDSIGRDVRGSLLLIKQLLLLLESSSLLLELSLLYDICNDIMGFDVLGVVFWDALLFHLLVLLQNVSPCSLGFDSLKGSYCVNILQLLLIIRVQTARLLDGRGSLNRSHISASTPGQQWTFVDVQYRWRIKSQPCASGWPDERQPKGIGKRCGRTAAVNFAGESKSVGGCIVDGVAQ